MKLSILNFPYQWQCYLLLPKIWQVIALQKATRTIQTLCSEAKVSQRGFTSITHDYTCFCTIIGQTLTFAFFFVFEEPETNSNSQQNSSYKEIVRTILVPSKGPHPQCIKWMHIPHGYEKYSLLLNFKTQSQRSLYNAYNCPCMTIFWIRQWISISTSKFLRYFL